MVDFKELKSVFPYYDALDTITPDEAVAIDREVERRCEEKSMDYYFDICKEVIKSVIEKRVHNEYRETLTKEVNDVANSLTKAGEGGTMFGGSACEEWNKVCDKAYDLIADFANRMEITIG